MDALLSKVTQHAMNYAIRSGVAITSTYALKQLSKLLQTVKSDSRDELLQLQLRLRSKVRIISPAIDMIELIAARGNTSLESAVAMTKAIRCDIQRLGRQLADIVDADDGALTSTLKGKSEAEIEAEVERIKIGIKGLLAQIEDAVPYINLAITTSGVKLSTSLPPTVSPSRLLQASTFMTAGDSQYTLNPGVPVQIGPAFTLSMFMLFGAHAHRPQGADNVREMTWKEVIHKAQVKIMRVPLHMLATFQRDGNTRPPSDYSLQLPGENHAAEFAYQLVVIEDLDDDRVHDFSDRDEKPGPYEGVDLAGIREQIPIHEISKIFYADTGKILNIGSDAAINQPVLLLKRDINAAPPRQQYGASEENEPEWPFGNAADEFDEDSVPPTISNHPEERADAESSDDSDNEAMAQILREASQAAIKACKEERSDTWKLPQDLDPEWMAFEVYSVDEDSSDSDSVDSEDENVPEENIEQSAKETAPRSPGQHATEYLASAFSTLSVDPRSPQTPQYRRSIDRGIGHEDETNSLMLSRRGQSASALPPLRTSLSSLELLMRLTSLQQFTQSSHLVSPDELLNFFLSESSTVGAGSDSSLRQQVRRAARQKVGFDPYDESPVKFRTEDGIQRGPGTAGSSPASYYQDYPSPQQVVPSDSISSRLAGRSGHAAPPVFSPPAASSRQHWQRRSRGHIPVSSPATPLQPSRLRPVEAFSIPPSYSLPIERDQQGVGSPFAPGEGNEQARVADTRTASVEADQFGPPLSSVSKEGEE